jgi:IclR family acetate operon transcriptional repressor
MPHCTGVGKAILSTLSDPEVRALLARTGMPPRTEHTITSPDAMVAALAVVRKQGYAVDAGDHELGVRCVAVRIRGLPFRAALSVSGPSSRVTAEQVPVIAPDIQAAATRVRLAFHAMS